MEKVQVKEAVYRFSDTLKSMSANTKEGISNFMSEKMKFSGSMLTVNAKSGGLADAALADDSFMGQAAWMYNSAKDYVASSSFSPEGMMNSMHRMMDGMPTWVKTCGVLCCLGLFFLISALIVLSMWRRRRHRGGGAMQAAAMAQSAPAVSSMSHSAWKLAVDANQAGRMRLIMAAVKIYFYCWIKHVYLRVKDLIHVLLAPLRTAYYIMRVLGNRNKMEMALHLEAWRIAYIAIANNAVPKQHMVALKAHGEHICKYKVMTVEDRQAWAQVMDKIATYK